MDALTAGLAPSRPPAAWFENPALDGPTPLNVTDAGQVYGHVATWGTCHTGRPDRCTTAPKSRSGYALFRLKQVVCDNGQAVDVGSITMQTGHAGLRESATSAIDHYDHTGTIVADVAAGEDAAGIWIAGALRPTADECAVRELRGAALSGDWRPIGGALELVAILAVPVPGFPIPRTRALAADGRVTALVAAGPLQPAGPVVGRSSADDYRDVRRLVALTQVDRVALARRARG